MALNFYMTVEGAKQKFPGTCLLTGHTHEMIGHACSFGVKSPRDAASGLATGKRQHSPVTVVTPTGKNSPLFMQAAATSEKLPSVVLSFYAPSKMTGTENNFFIVKLTNASIVSVKLHGQLTLDPALTKYPELDEIEFAFETISWEYKGTDGNVLASDVSDKFA